MAQSTPQDTPSPQKARSLADEINVATRQTHTHLNRLITARLPLALPPHTISPLIYGHGLFRFSHIYLTFESLWLEIIHSTPLPEFSPDTTCSAECVCRELDPLLTTVPKIGSQNGNYCNHVVKESRRVHAYLQHLLLPGLIRSQRLKEDLSYLTGLGGAELEQRLDNPDGKRAAEFVAHIRAAVNEKPHVLVAYAWVMYMALFSGGRWMRAVMREAGAEFWDMPLSVSGNGDATGHRARETVGMEFFNWKGPDDGEDIKAEFKRRFAEVDGLLTPTEREDVVTEAFEIFKLCAMLVEELDGAFPSTEAPVLPSHQRTPARVDSTTEKAKLMTNAYFEAFAAGFRAFLRLLESIISSFAFARDSAPQNEYGSRRGLVDKQNSASVTALAGLAAAFLINCLWYLWS